MENLQKEYYAHSLQGKPRSEWQPLEVHLKNVAELAASFGNNDTVKFLFNIAGMLHDFGKYQIEFQKYLVEGGTRGSVPHAVWGAGYARILGMNEITFAIDGHHKGLPNKSDLKIDTEKFKRKDVTKFDSIIESFIKDTAFSENNAKSLSLKYSDPLQKELFIRYLFSSLIDADWLDTEAFYDPDKSQNRGNYILSVDGMIEKLGKEFSNKSKDGEINKLRNLTRESVLKKCEKSLGFYSLNLPTGMGKTLLSIAWALNHAKNNDLKRIIVVLPYINIIDQTAKELKRIFGEEWVLEHHSGYNENDQLLNNDDDLDILQKRKKLACENWDYPIIITTTVQFLESIFNNKPSKCRKIHNIAESIVIFDEVQSFQKEAILPTLSILKNIQSVMKTSFLFCTATQPAFEKKDKFDGIDSIIPLVDNPLEIFNKTIRVNYNFLENLEPLEIETMMKFLLDRDSSVLAIFNTKKSVKIFFEMINKNSGYWGKTYHLSTAMCPVHRMKVIDDIRKDLKEKRKIFVSSTQLIEAGVDFDFPCVFREIAPLESIVQSAGRCNREGNMPEKGDVFIFQLKDSNMPDKTYKACAEHTKILIQTDINKLYEHNFFKEYYSQILNLFIDSDKNKILKAQENFDFKTVSQSYRVIDNKTENLFIYNYNEESRQFLHSIEYKKFLLRDDYRKMQVFTVQVYQDFLIKNNSSITKMPQGFLVWYGDYDSGTGISVEAIEADKLIL